MNEPSSYGSLRNNEPIPNQLSNPDLFRNKELAAQLFPGGVLEEEIQQGVLDKKSTSRQRIVLPKQFIAADFNLEFLTVGATVTITVEDEASNTLAGQTYSAVVKQARQFEPRGKRYVLLESTTDANLVPLEGARNVRVTAGNQSGVIHPGGSDGGGGQVHAGGQSNAYGVSVLNLTPPQAPAVTPNLATYETDAKPTPHPVAVLDTGLYFQRPPANRHPVANEADIVQYQRSLGWDFVNRDAFPVDDHPEWHGTKISSILKKTAPGKSGVSPGILPVKVANHLGVLTLYDAVCGLAYAKSKGARVVNASWSFTGLSTTLTLLPPPANQQELLRQPSRALPDYPVLYQAVKDLQASGVLVLAAAGNRSQYPSPTGEIGANGAPLIYPACYSPVLDNVITVTTVSYQINNPNTPGVSRHFVAYENYSPKFVDTGVLTNASVDTEGPNHTQKGNFVIPGFSASPSDAFRGTSYATPYVAGRVAALLTQPTGVVQQTVSSKNTLMPQLNGLIQTNDLADELRIAGYYPAG